MINLSNLKNLVGMGKALVLAHRPELLYGASVVSTLASLGLAAKGGYESGRQIERKEQEEQRVIPVKEQLQLTWMNYLPAAGTGLAAIGATTGLHIVHVQEKKQLAAVALLAIDEVKDEAKKYRAELEAADPEKAKKADEEILADRAERNDGSAVIYQGDGVVEELYRVKDEYTGRVFWSTKEKIDAAVNEVNKALNKNGDCDINTFYMWAGIEELDRGIETGWSGALVSVKWEDDHTENGRPVRKFMFHPQPRKGYDDSHA